MERLTENLVRTSVAPMELRTGDGSAVDGNTMFGQFTTFDTFAEINSRREGRFLERNAPGMLDRTIANRRSQIKVLFDHGADPSIGNKVLGEITDLRADSSYTVDLLDAPYVNDLKPGLKRGLYGASYRFSIADKGEVWHHPKQPSAHNPLALPERTVTAVDVYEFGPVTFPAFVGATAGVRSIASTDDFVDALTDPLFVLRLTERLGAKTVEQIITAVRSLTVLGLAGDAPDPNAAAGDAPGTPIGTHPSVTRARIAAAIAATNPRKV